MQEKRSNLDCSQYKTVCTPLKNFKCEVEVRFSLNKVTYVYALLGSNKNISISAELCMPGDFMEQVPLGQDGDGCAQDSGRV